MRRQTAILLAVGGVLLVLLPGLGLGVGYLVGRWQQPITQSAGQVAPAATPLPAATTSAAVPSAGQPPTTSSRHTGDKLEERVSRLRRFDREAMGLLGSGRKHDGFKKLIAAVEPYKNALPGDCTPEEALVVGVLYTRVVAIAGNSLPKEITETYIAATRVYSERGGVAPEQYLEWFGRIVRETVAAYKVEWEDVLRRANELARREVETEPERTKQELDLTDRIHDQIARRVIEQWPLGHTAPPPDVLSNMRRLGLRAFPDAHRIVQGQATSRLETALHLRFDAARLRGVKIDVNDEAERVLRAWYTTGGIYTVARNLLATSLEEYYLHGPPSVVQTIVEPAYQLITRDGPRYIQPDGTNMPRPKWMSLPEPNRTEERQPAARREPVPKPQARPEAPLPWGESKTFPSSGYTASRSKPSPPTTRTACERAVLARSVKLLDEYYRADDAAAKAMRKAGDVVILIRPTQVVVETIVDGFAYVRPAEGPHEGRFFVVNAKSVGK